MTGVAAPPPPPSHAYDALADARAWCVGVEGRFFYDRRVRGGGIAAGGLLNRRWPTGRSPSRTRPSTVGSRCAQRSSPFSAVAAFDFAYEDFAAIPASGCGDAPAACGLSAVGSASIGGDGASATLLLGGGGAPMDAGAIWQREALPLAAGFESDFTFRVSGRTLCAEAPRAPPPGQGASGAGGGDGSAACDESALIGGTGFGFVIHSHVERSASLGCAGSGLGIRRATPDEAGEGGGGDAEAAGIGGGGGACAECVAPALVLRFDTHADLEWDHKRRAPVWRHHNELRLLTNDCRAGAPPPEALAVVSLTEQLPRPIDDGAWHEARVRYVGHTLQVLIDGKLVLFMDLRLRAVAPSPLAAYQAAAAATAAAATAATAAAAPLATTEVSVAANVSGIASQHRGGLLLVDVLDRRGFGYLGFAASSGAIGAEQYDIGMWRFERYMGSLPDGPPLTELEAEVAAAIEEEAVMAASARNGTARWRPRDTPPYHSSSSSSSSSRPRSQDLETDRVHSTSPPLERVGAYVAKTSVVRLVRKSLVCRRAIRGSRHNLCQL